jgi:hypothetical protein
VAISRPDEREADRLGRRLTALADPALGLVSVLVDITGRAAHVTGAAVAPPLRAIAAQAPHVPGLRRGSAVVRTLRDRGERVRADVVTQSASLPDRLIPALVAYLLDRVDLTDVVVGHVDVNRVVAQVDIDAAAARIDVGTVVDRVDVAHVVGRVDLDAVASRIDVDAVARRVDVNAVLDRLDLTDMALSRLDLDVLVPAILEHVDIPGIAEQVLDAVDLPAIIRDSSGALTSDTIRGARMRGAAGDQALGRMRARLVPRRHGSTDSSAATEVTPGPGPGAPAPLDHP